MTNLFERIGGFQAVDTVVETFYRKVLMDDRIKDFFDDTVLSEMKFLKEALNTYKQKRIGLSRIVEVIFRDKLYTVVEYIRNLIETYYFEQIKTDIDVFDKQIEQNKRHLARIINEKDDATTYEDTFNE